MTQSTPLPSEKKMLDDAKRRNNAVRIATTLSVATIPTVGFFLFLSVQNRAWQLYVMSGVLIVLAGIFFISARAIHRDNVLNGVRWMLAGVAATILLSVFMFSGVSFLLGITLILLAAIVTFQTLPDKPAREALFIATGLGIFAAATDLFGLDYRLPVPEALKTFAPILILVVMLFIGVIIVLASYRQISAFWRASIRNRLTFIVAGSALIPVVLVSIVLAISAYVQIKNALTQEAFNKLAAVQTIKAHQVQTYLAERQNDIVVLGKTMATYLNEALTKMDVINTLKQAQIIRLFQTWDADVRDVASDPGVVEGILALSSGLKEAGLAQVRTFYLGHAELSFAPDGSAYSSAHSEQHGFFKGYISIHGYEDAYLINPAGDVVYTVNKKDVFGTNLLTGSYRDSNLAKLYKNLLNAQSGSTYIADVAKFEGENAMFIGAPIYDGTRFVGILAYRLPLGTINSIMTDRTGLGETADTYLIAREDDGRITYRSDRSIVGNGQYVIGFDLTDLAPQFMQDVLNGISGGQLVIGSVGDAVINSYKPLGVKGLNWAVLARITAVEAFSPLRSGEEQDFLTAYKEDYGFHDLLLIEPGGLVFYTVEHEADYRTNILTGPFKETNLGSLVDEVLESKSYEFVDFAPYAPTNGVPAAFFGMPVLDKQNNVQMIVAVQASQQEIEAIMAEKTGLGETGETFLIGQDATRRTETRFLSELGVTSTLLDQKFRLDTVSSRSVLAGEAGQGTHPDYRGVQVMEVWSPVMLTETSASKPEEQFWGLIAQIDLSEALGPVNRLAGAIGVVVGLAVLIIGTLAVLLGTRFASGFVQPILNLTDTATQIAAGNMDLAVKVETGDEVGTLSTAFNTMTAQLRDLIGSLEARVAARTKDLATVAEVGTATATILETDRLLQEVVDLTKERFNLYHSHIYLLDAAGENLVLASGAGEVGRRMVAEKRFIPLSREQSLVARAARERKGVTVNDVTLAPDFLPNPLLPNTRAELAVPMVVGGDLIGVFDIQSDQAGRFTESDINIQTTLAAQVATSIQNVRQFEQSKAQAELETLVNAIGQKIQRTGSVEETLQTAARELGLALGAIRVKANLQPRPENIKASEN